jgi:putative membrane protein
MTRSIGLSIQGVALAALVVVAPAHAQPPRPQDPAQPPTAAQPPRPGDAARDSSREGVSAADRTFARKAAEGGHKEVALAKIAQRKASSEDVKRYAQTLERDHSQANHELKSWATSKNVTLPPAPADGKTVDAKLEGLEGAAFDKAYIAAMIQDHRKDIAAFEKEAASGADPDLKAFVQKTLPTLKGHLEQAEKAQASIASKRTSS